MPTALFLGRGGGSWSCADRNRGHKATRVRVMNQSEEDEAEEEHAQPAGAADAEDDAGPEEDAGESRGPPNSRHVKNRTEWQQFRSVFKNNTQLASNLYDDRLDGLACVASRNYPAIHVVHAVRRDLGTC